MKFIATLVAVLSLASVAQAFVSPKVHSTKSFVAIPKHNSGTPVLDLRKCTTVARHMSYNLPPAGGGSGGGDDNKDLQGILGGLGTIAAIGLFFASPLGSIFFAITNSLFLLALLIPVGGFVAFQGWQFFNTLEGPCPNCGAPVRILKDTDQPSLCFTCGSVLQASSDQKTVEFAKENPVVGDNDGFGGAESIFDGLLNQNRQQQPGGGVTGESPKVKESKFRREQTVIDVEVEDE